MTTVRSEFPLTRFLGTLLSYTDRQLAGACPDKAAAHYGINRDHAQGFIDQQRELRGVVPLRRAA